MQKKMPTLSIYNNKNNKKKKKSKKKWIKNPN